MRVDDQAGHVWPALGSGHGTHTAVGPARYDKVPEAINFQALVKNFNSRFLSQKTPYHAVPLMWRLLTQES